MPLPSSGQISIDNLRDEVSQSCASDYSLYGASNGIRQGYSNIFVPINVHEDNTGNYPFSSSNYPLSDFHSYDSEAFYVTSIHNRDLFLSQPPASVCYGSSMVIFDLGTNNTTQSITISGSTDDFQGIDNIQIFYGTPWSCDGSNTGSYAPIDDIFVNQTEYNNTFDYNYIYDSNRGQYLYIVAIAGCY